MNRTLHRNITICCLIILAGYSMNAQPLSTAHFDNYESWDLYTPGDIKLDNEELSDLRIEYAANEMGGPGGPNMKLYMDVLDVMFKGRPADWIQWTFTPTGPPEAGTGTPSLDLLIVDQETYQLLFRLHPNGRPQPGQWMRPYGYIQGRPEGIRQVTVQDDSTVMASVETIDPGSPLYEFAALGFMFPFIDLYEGRSFQLKRHHFPSKTAPVLAVKVMGEVKIPDAKGKMHKAWQVETMGPSRSSIVRYYVSKKAPYFYGWDYKRVEDGVSLFKMDYRGWISGKVVN